MMAIIHKFIIVLLSVCLLLLNHGVIAADSSQNETSFDEVIRYSENVITALMDEEDLQGATISLVYQGNQVWSKGYGTASKQENSANHLFTNETNISQLELAKLFTAVGIMQLVEQGNVQLDEAFNQYIPEFTPYIGGAGNADFTIRQLLSHHSGLPFEYSPNKRFLEGEILPNDFETSYRDILQHSQEIAMVSEPGQVYSYSYLGYTLLGLLIEEVSGLSVADYMEEHIFAPLQMNNSYFGTAIEISATSRVYIKSKEYNPAHYRDVPANGLISNAADMSLFMQALMNGGQGIISNDSLEEMFRSQNEGVLLDDNFEMGLGFFITPVTGGLFRNENSISHASDQGISRSYFLAFPDHQMAVLFGTNTQLNSVKVRDTADSIIEKMLSAVMQISPSIYTPHAEVEFDSNQVEELLGSFSGPGGVYYLEQKRKKIVLKAPFIPFLSIRLIPREDDFYGVKLKILGFFGFGFMNAMKMLNESLEGKLKEIDGQKYIYWYWRGTASVTLSQVEPSEKGASLDAWLARTTSYQLESEEREYDLEFDEDSGNFLFGPHRGAFSFLSDPPELFCVESETELRHCGSGLEGTGTKNVLRIVENGRLLDAFGQYYSQ